MMEKNEINGEFEINVKRFYLPITIKRKCPKCGNLCENDKNMVD